SRPICIRSAVETTKPPAYPFIIINVKEHRRQNKPRRQSTSDPVRLIFQISRDLQGSAAASQPRHRRRSASVRRYLGNRKKTRKRKNDEGPIFFHPVGNASTY
ncbi:hypothetical protein, partial [Cereibacter johrii]|uniref:hypothetical protein n=1 Tax=Cereibacter johrii TaxID=445629 RepID=UPI003CF559A0